MDTIENIIDKLNDMLSYQGTDFAEYLILFDRLKSEFNLKFLFIDLDKYNEESMVEHQKKKLEAASQRNFEYAAWHRNMENECKEYIKLKNSLNVTRPMFVHDGEILFCFFFGKPELERVIKEIFQKFTIKK